MKNTILFILFLSLAGKGFGQLGTNEYSAAIFNRISIFYKDIKATFKDTLVLRRVETGILEEGKDNLLGSIQRKLYQGNGYLVAAFTDARVRNYELRCYKKNTETDKWDFVKSITEPGRKSDDNLLADMKVLSTTATEDGTYMFEIVADKNVDKSTSRYAIMLWSEQTAATGSSGNSGSGNSGSGNNGGTSGGSGGSTSSATANNTYYSVDNVDYCVYDSVQKNFKICTNKPDASSLFELNANGTMFTHTTADLTSRYYVKSKKFDKDLNVYEYQVMSDVGNGYTFYVPVSGSGFFSILKDNGNQSYLLKHHIKSSWTGQ